jgi:hypothetical protein
MLKKNLSSFFLLFMSGVEEHGAQNNFFLSPFLSTSYLLDNKDSLKRLHAVFE